MPIQDLPKQLMYTYLYMYTYMYIYIYIYKYVVTYILHILYCCYDAAGANSLYVLRVNIMEKARCMRNGDVSCDTNILNQINLLAIHYY